jgi:hypothetical protein
MKMGKSWCCLFTTGAVAIGGAVWGTLASGEFCRQKFLDKALSKFEGNFNMPSFQFNASMAPGLPLMSFDFRNVTGAAGQFLTPSFISTLYEMAEDAKDVCMSVTAEQSLLIITLGLALGSGYLYLQGQINDLTQGQYRPLSNDDQDNLHGYRRM